MTTGDSHNGSDNLHRLSDQVSANTVLAIQPARRHAAPASGLPRQAALADRARLSRAQAGAGPRTLRGSRLARLSPPWCALHRGLRLSLGRAGRDSPLGPRCRPVGRSASASRRSSTPRRLRCDRSAMSRTRLPPCAAASPTTWRSPSRDVRAAPRQCSAAEDATATYDAVVDLQAAIKRYLDEHNQNPRPFVWTKPAKDILAKLERLTALRKRMNS